MLTRTILKLKNKNNGMKILHLYMPMRRCKLMIYNVLDYKFINNEEHKPWVK